MRWPAAEPYRELPGPQYHGTPCSGERSPARGSPRGRSRSSACWSERPLRRRRLRQRRASFFGDAQDHRHRAVVVGLGVGHAPVDVVVTREPIHRLLVFITLAETITAAHLSAAVIVGNNVIASVGRIVAGANPGNGRGLCAGRTGRGGPAATGAQKSINGTVLPILAVLLIGARPGRFLRPCRAINRQQRQQRGSGEQLTQRRQQAAPRSALGEGAGAVLNQAIELLHGFNINCGVWPRFFSSCCSF